MLCFHLSVLEQGCFGSPGVCPFTALLFAPMCMSWCPCAEVRGPRAKCQGWSREQFPPEQTSLLPLPQHLAFLSQLPPLAASPSSCGVRAKCPRCYRAHISAVVPLTLGAIPPHAPRQSPFCRGQSRAGGAGLGRVAPNTNKEGERVYPGSWGGDCRVWGLQGLGTARPPPPARGTGRGKGGLAAAPGNKESVWLVTALRKRGETNVPLIGGEVT